VTEQTLPQRKYALTKIAPGDYLFPSNDAKTVWRIARYEDGPSHGVDSMDRDRTFWGLWKWDSPLAVGSAVDTLSWERWGMEGSGFDTRQEAIDEALKS
jgi:hypothetical protein